MPPPSLLTTTTHRSGRGSPGPIESPGASCSRDRSPMSANATVPGWSAAWASAAPAAVEKVPSIPLAPRLAITRAFVRGGSARSTSRTDSELPHHSSASPGNAATTSRATSGSERSPPRQASSTAVAAAAAAASALRHCASHEPAADWPSDARSGAPVSLTAAATSVAARCGSAHSPGPCAITTCLTGDAALAWPARPVPADSVPAGTLPADPVPAVAEAGPTEAASRASRSSRDCGRVSPGRPAEMITVGRWAAMNSGDASRYW